MGRIPSVAYSSGKNLIEISYEVTGLISKVAKMATLGLLVKFVIDSYSATRPTKEFINIGTKSIPIKIFLDKNKGPMLETSKWVENLLKSFGSAAIIFGKSFLSKPPKNNKENTNIQIIREMMQKLKKNNDEFDLDDDDLKDFRK